MRHSELLVRWLSFAGSKAIDFIYYIYPLLNHFKNGFIFIIKHPLKTIKIIILSFFWLTFTAFFATLALASDYLDYSKVYDVTSPVGPKTETLNTYQCDIGSDAHNKGKTMPEACRGVWAAKVEAYGSARCFFKYDWVDGYEVKGIQGVKLWNGDCEHRPYQQRFGANARDLGVVETNKVCPPDANPRHTNKLRLGVFDGVWTRDPTASEMCYRSLEPNEIPEEPKTCGDLVGNDSSWYQVTTPNEHYPDSTNIKCLKNGNGPDASYCETTSTKFLATHQTDTHTTWSPVGGGTFTGAKCANASSPVPPETKDLFCSVTDSDGVYMVDCPESQIAINWNTVKSLTEFAAQDNKRIAALEAGMLTTDKLRQMIESDPTLKGQDGEQGQQGEKGEKGEQGIAGRNGVDGKDGLDGESCTVVDTPEGATISCGESVAVIDDGETCTTKQEGVNAIIECNDGTRSVVEGVDEGSIVSAVNANGQKLGDELAKQTAILEGISGKLDAGGEGDGDGTQAPYPSLDLDTKPDAWTQIAEFKWEEKNFGTVLQEHVDELKTNKLFTAVDKFFNTSFSGSCPKWSTQVNIMSGNFTVTIDQFCSEAAQSVIPIMKAIILLVASFFGWRIAIE